MAKKVLFAGIIAGIFSNLWGLLTCRWLFKWIYLINPVDVYRASMLTGERKWLILMGIGKIMIAIILTSGYASIYRKIPNKGVKKGIIFGFLIWLMGMLPARFLLYMSINISTAIITYWIINDLISYLLIGAIIGKIYKD